MKRFISVLSFCIWLFAISFVQVPVAQSLEECQPEVISSSIADEGAKDVHVVGDYAYIANYKHGLMILNVSNPLLPVLVSTIDTNGVEEGVYGQAEGIFVQDGYTYIADGEVGLTIVDVSDPFSPSIVASVELGDWAYDVSVSNGHAYIANSGNGLTIVDVSDPSNPEVTSTFDTDGWANGVYVKDNFAYIADGSKGLKIINISDPKKPTLEGSIATGNNTRDLEVIGSTAYVASAADGLIIVDVSVPSAPDIIGSIDDSNAWALKVRVIDDYAYVAYSTEGLKVIDISTPQSPTIIHTETTDSYSSGVHAVNGYAYLADSHGGLKIYNISSPTSITIAGVYNENGYSEDVYVKGNYAYVAAHRKGFKIVNISDVNSPIVLGSVDTYKAKGVYVHGNYAFVADSSEGLKIIDVSLPIAPDVVASIETHNARDVYVRDDYAYLADGDEGLKIIDISDLTSIDIVGSISTDGYADDIILVGDYAYIANRNQGLVIVNIQNPLSAEIVGSLFTGGFAQGISVSGQYAYLADGPKGLSIINISDEKAPVLAGSASASGVRDAYFSNGYVYLTSDPRSLMIVDVSDPASPSIDTSLFTDGWGFGIHIAKGYAFVANYDMGLKIIDIATCMEDMPIARFTASETTGFNLLDVDFTNQSVNNPDSCVWDFGDDTIVNSCEDQTHQYDVGTYTVSLTVTNVFGTDSVVKNDYITVYDGQEPIARFSADITSGEAPLTVQFTDESLNDPETWHWDFGDGNTSSAQNPQHTFENVGVYSVKLTVSNSAGSDSTSGTAIDAHVKKPVASFDASHTSGEAPLTVQFTDTSENSPEGWLWSINDDSITNDQNLEYTFNEPGTYIVSLMVYKNICHVPNCSNIVYSKAEKTITVETPSGNKPVADFTKRQLVNCDHAVPLIADVKNGEKCKWEFGDGSYSVIDDNCDGLVHSYPIGTYTVSLIAYNEFGSDRMTKYDYVTVTENCDSPIADFEATPTKIEIHQKVQFTNKSINATALEWNVGDGTTYTAEAIWGWMNYQDFTHTYHEPGNYTVTLIASNKDSSDTIIKNEHIIVTKRKPIADFIVNQDLGTYPLTVQFTDQSKNDPDTWHWDFGDGQTSDLQNPSYTYTTPGEYTASLTVSSSGGSDTATIIIKVKAIKPIAKFSVDTDTGLYPLTVQFTDNSLNDPDTWYWNFGDGETSDLQNPSHIYTTPGQYIARLTVSNSEGSDTIATTINVIEMAPIAEFTADVTEGYAPLTVQFTDESENYPTEWHWAFDGVGQRYEQNPTVTFEKPGNYTVSLLTSNKVGTDQITKTHYITVKSDNEPETKPEELSHHVKVGKLIDKLHPARDKLKLKLINIENLFDLELQYKDVLVQIKSCDGTIYYTHTADSSEIGWNNKKGIYKNGPTKIVFKKKKSSIFIIDKKFDFNDLTADISFSIRIGEEYEIKSDCTTWKEKIKKNKTVYKYQ